MFFLFLSLSLYLMSRNLTFSDFVVAIYSSSMPLPPSPLLLRLFGGTFGLVAIYILQFYIVYLYKLKSSTLEPQNIEHQPIVYVCIIITAK